MSTQSTSIYTVEDGFETYYAEKLWEMIPPIYRLEDGLAIQPERLRSIVEIIARQAAILRRSQDRLWDDSFIELCDAWAVPYIGELLGTRLVSASNPRGRRVDVAKTIYYRRRKGTLRVLEELISDITGWEGKVVEEFKRLVRARHGLDPEPEPLRGRTSGSLPGGVADLRLPHASTRAHSPFDEYHHAPDFRQQRGYDGRYNLPKLGFHLYRLKAYRIVNSIPFHIVGSLRYGFDPSGRQIPLFNRRERGTQSYDWDEWHSAMEWELPAPLSCRLLNEAVYLFTDAVIDKLDLSPGLTAAQEADLRLLIGYPIRTEARLRETLAALPTGPTILVAPFLLYRAILLLAMVDQCGKEQTLPETVIVNHGGAPISKAVITGGSLATWNTNLMPVEKVMMIDPERGRFAFETGAGPGTRTQTVSYHYAFSGDIGAGPYDRRAVDAHTPASLISASIALTTTNLLANGVSQIQDNYTYGSAPNILNVQAMRFQARNSCRPFIRLRSNWILDTGTNRNATLVLDGLWIGSRLAASIILRGDYECVTIQNCTIDPGGGLRVDGSTVPPVTIRVEGHVELLVIDQSIVGPITVAGTGVVEEIRATDSIFQSITVAPAIFLVEAAACMERVTVVGTSRFHTLRSQDALYTGICNVTDTQQGCFRYSVAPLASRVPRAYPHPLRDFGLATQWFTSMVFGQPGYLQLSEVAPLEIARGAENGSEVGAFCSLLNPIKLDSLQVKVAEYMPFGLIPLFIPET
jgi:hypothetical protein